MKYFQTRMAFPTFLGFAFGIFFTLSCATTQTAETSEQPRTSQEQFDTQLNRLNAEIRDNPENDALKVQKATLLAGHANTFQNPGQRNPLYRNMNDLSRNVNPDSREMLQIDRLLKNAWSTERNEGVRLLQEDRSESFDNHFDDIVAHLDNAITLIPDSLVTYSLKATTLYRRGHLSDAIATLESARERTDANKPDIDEKLAYLHLESGNAPESIRLYSGLTQNYPSNEHFQHGLINALIINEQHEDAAELLREMTERYPSRHHYRESLATEMYRAFSYKANRMTDRREGLYDDSIRDLFNILEEIHTIFEDLQDQVPSNEETTFRKAVIYKNAALKLSEIRNILPPDRVTSSELADFHEEYMMLSLPHWERLAELNPDNMDYMNSLYTVYLELGMDEDAESIERMYNF